MEFPLAVVIFMAARVIICVVKIITGAIVQHEHKNKAGPD